MNAQPTQRTGARRVAVGLAVAAALVTSACAAGQRSETSEELPTLDGTNANVGKIALRGLAIVTPDGATYGAGSNPQLRVVIVNNSDGTDQLTSVSSSATTGGWGAYSSTAALGAAASPTASSTPSTQATVTGTPIVGSTGSTPTGSAPTAGASSSATSAPTSTAPQADKPITVARGVAVSFGVPAAQGRILALLGTTSTLYPGSSINVTFTFAKAGSKTFPVPIELSDAGSYTPSPSYVPGETQSEGPAQQEEGS